MRSILRISIWRAASLPRAQRSYMAARGQASELEWKPRFSSWKSFHVAASPVSMSDHGGHFRRALCPWLVFVSGGVELPESRRALSPQAHTYWAFSMTCILLWWAPYRKPVRRKKKRTEESTWGWKGNQVYSLYWNKSNSLWMSTFVWFLLKIWLRYRLLQWPQGTNEHFIFLCCQVGWYVLSSAPNSWMWKDRFEHEWWEAFCVSCVWET